MSAFLARICQWHWRKYLGTLGKNCILHPEVYFDGFRKNIHLADEVRIGRHATLDCDHPSASIHIGRRTVICQDAKLLTYKGDIRIGDFCSVNPFCVLYGIGGLFIGNYVRIAAHTIIVPANHLYDDPEVPITHQGLSRKGVHIEDDVWLGAGVRILDGCTIGRGTVVAAGAVVTEDVEPYSVIAGVPAKLIKKRK